MLVGGKLLAERAFAEQATRTRCSASRSRSSSCRSCWSLFLGGLVAGLLPLVAALATIAGSLLVLNALAGAVAVSEFAVNVVTLLGLGLAVDYSLLMIARFREERAADPGAPLGGAARRGPPRARAAPCSSPASRSAIALAALYVFADPLLSAMALGGGARGRDGHAGRAHARPRADRGRARRIPAPGSARGCGGASDARPGAAGAARRLRAAPPGRRGAHRDGGAARAQRPGVRARRGQRRRDARCPRGARSGACRRSLERDFTHGRGRADHRADRAPPTDGCRQRIGQAAAA